MSPSYLTAQSYASDGFAAIPELISSEEALALQFECERVFDVTAGHPDRLGSVSPMIQNLGRDRRLSELADELLGEPALLMTESLATTAGLPEPQQMAVPPEAILAIAVAVQRPNTEQDTIRFHNDRGVRLEPGDAAVFSAATPHQIDDGASKLLLFTFNAARFGYLYPDLDTLDAAACAAR
ncbi:MAG: hypothetical protein R2748_27285 [Bryobacterales bacterium]